MSDLREAAEMALEALNIQTPLNNREFELRNSAIEALRQALAQQERVNEITRQFVGVNEDGSERWVETEYRTVIRSEWVGLTDEEIDGLWKMAQMFRAHKHFYLLVEAKLKEKNHAS